MVETKYFCNFCGKEINDKEVVYASLDRCPLIGSCKSFRIHFHKDCFVKFLGEKEYNECIEEREAEKARREERKKMKENKNDSRKRCNF